MFPFCHEAKLSLITASKTISDCVLFSLTAAMRVSSSVIFSISLFIALHSSHVIVNDPSLMDEAMLNIWCDVHMAIARDPQLVDE